MYPIHSVIVFAAIISLLLCIHYLNVGGSRLQVFLQDPFFLSNHHDDSMILFPGFEVDSFTTNEWKYILTSKGVDVYTKKVPGTKLLAFRGVAILDLPIRDILRPFSNLTLSYEWIDLLKSIKAYDIDPTIISPIVNENITEYFITKKSDIVYQYLSLPWPISPRELLLKRSWDINHSLKSVTFRYISVNDHRIPFTKGVIRAISPHTVWRFSSVVNSCNKSDSNSDSNGDSNSSNDNDVSIVRHRHRWKQIIHTINSKIRGIVMKLHQWLGKRNQYQNRKQPNQPNHHIPTDILTTNRQGSSCTRVEIECLVDSKGGLPAWFLNYIQRSFPSKSIEAFSKLAKSQLGKGQDFPFVASW